MRPVCGDTALVGLRCLYAAQFPLFHAKRQPTSQFSSRNTSVASGPLPQAGVRGS